MHRLFLTTELSLSSGALVLISRPPLVLSQIVDGCNYQMSNQHEIRQRAVTPSQKPDACSHNTLICHLLMHIKFCSVTKHNRLMAFTQTLYTLLNAGMCHALLPSCVLAEN